MTAPPPPLTDEQFVDLETRACNLTCLEQRKLAVDARWHRDALTNRLIAAIDELARRRAEVERLRAAVEQFLTAPSGASICACHNINAVKAGMERPCAYCVARAALAPEGKEER